MRKRDPRHIISFFSHFFDLEKMIKRTRQNTVFPFYHAVNDNPGPHLKYLYPVKSEREFKEDLDKILKHFRPVSPTELFDSEARRKNAGFILSFDDGLREVYEIIAPILKEKGIPAIFFLNNSFIDNKGLFYRYKASLIVDKIEKGDINKKLIKIILQKTARNINVKDHMKRFVLDLKFHNSEQLDGLCRMLEIDIEDFLGKERPYLTSNEINELINQGFYIGAHSFDHPDFFMLEPGQQLQEIKRSVIDIRNRFALNYSFFAFPFTDYGVKYEILDSVHHENSLKPFISFGTSGIAADINLAHYQRLSMEKYKGSSEQIITAEYLYFRLKQMIGKS